MKQSNYFDHVKKQVLLYLACEELGGIGNTQYEIESFEKRALELYEGGNFTGPQTHFTINRFAHRVNGLAGLLCQLMDARESSTENQKLGNATLDPFQWGK